MDEKPSKEERGRDTEYIEGPDAWTRFDEAISHIVTVPKTVIDSLDEQRRQENRRPRQ